MEVCKASGGLGLGLAQCHFHCIVLNKANHKAGLDSRMGKDSITKQEVLPSHPAKGCAYRKGNNRGECCKQDSKEVLSFLGVRGMSRLQIRYSVMEVEGNGYWGTACILYDTSFQSPVLNALPPPGSLP